jgi:hypothetical protein
MLNKIENIRTAMSGKKVYALIALGIVVSLSQYLFGIDLHIPDLKPATTVGELMQQLYIFAIGGGFRAALAK